LTCGNQHEKEAPESFSVLLAKNSTVEKKQTLEYMLTEGLNGEPFPANCVANICGGQPLRTSKVFVVKSCPSIPTLLKYFLCG
jgi:hypothetical protein